MSAQDARGLEDYDAPLEWRAPGAFFKARRKVWITANDKAEGSAPLSLAKLAAEIANNLH